MLSQHLIDLIAKVRHVGHHWLSRPVYVHDALYRPVVRVGKGATSVIPTSFWIFSILGGSIVLAYAIERQDPVFIVGQATGLLIYFRNLYFVWRNRHAEPKI